MGARLQITPPPDFLLKRDVCSYGYYRLAPNRWDPRALTFSRPLNLETERVGAVIAQPSDEPGGKLSVALDRAVDRRERAEVRRMVTRMLRLDEDLSEFHRVDPRWKRSGRGRIFRSPTFFEDVVKTITSCNVTWGGTKNMNRRLCAVIEPAFPKPSQLARRRPASLRGRCGVGYRDVRLVELAKGFVSGAIDPAWFESSEREDEELRKALLALPGVGPYAANNLMQLLGRYSRVPIDTEAIRHGKEALGLTGTAAQIERGVKAHYEQFGSHQFRSYWLAHWTSYEKERGAAWTWPADEG